MVRNFSGILSGIGHTPTVKLLQLFPAYRLDIFAKLEYLNPSGSIKDRTACMLLQKGIEAGQINGDTVILESTSGNMGVGLAQACKYLGLKLILVVDPLINTATEKLLRLYGAELHKVDHPDESGTFLQARLKKIENLQKCISNSFWTNQYRNQATLLAHKQTIQELIRETGEDLDYLFVATSTCGTIMSCSQALRRQGLRTKLIPVDAEGSKIFEDRIGQRKIPGMGASRKSDFLDRSQVEAPLFISDSESVAGCRLLLEREGILAGGSTGSVVSAISKMLDKIPDHSKVAFFVSDRGERYMDTVYSEDWVLAHGLTPTF
ncbi:2,3-diaminopropionate biosynthesis protein SbnA [Algoriphagus namhaensis]